MRIIKATDALHVVKPEGTDVHYYLFDEYEVHYNVQAPHTTQTWHHHEKISETIYLIEGKLMARWRENGEEKAKAIEPGCLVEVQNTPHTFSNEEKTVAKFLVLKRVDSGKEQKHILKTDKVLD